MPRSRLYLKAKIGGECSDKTKLKRLSLGGNRALVQCRELSVVLTGTEIGDRDEADSCTCWESGPETLARGWGRARARSEAWPVQGGRGWVREVGGVVVLRGAGPEEVGGSG